MLEAHKSAGLAAIRHWAQNRHSGLTIAADLNALVVATSQLSLSNLEDWERAIRWELDHVQPAFPFPKWIQRFAPQQPLTWLDVCSKDGFKREQALYSLSGPAPNRFFLALALRRLNDWVPQVRTAARQQLPLLAQASDPELVVEVLCATLPFWDSWGRMETADKHTLLEITAFEPVAQALKCRLISSPSGPMSLILSQASRTRSQDPYLAEIATAAIQPALRAKAYRYLLEGKTMWSEGKKWEWTDIRYCEGHFKPIWVERGISVTAPFLATLYSAAKDPSPRVRRVAGDVLLQTAATLGAEAGPLAQQLAADVCPSVAERGVFALKQLEKNV